jgi:hypothetical protein
MNSQQKADLKENINEMFPNLTEAENAFFVRMETAPEERKEHFRMALAQLMSCYGDNMPYGIVASHLSRETGQVSVLGINVSAQELVGMLQVSLLTVTNQMQVPDEAEVH